MNRQPVHFVNTENVTRCELFAPLSKGFIAKRVPNWYPNWYPNYQAGLRLRRVHVSRTCPGSGPAYNDPSFFRQRDKQNSLIVMASKETRMCHKYTINYRSTIVRLPIHPLQDHREGGIILCSVLEPAHDQQVFLLLLPLLSSHSLSHPCADIEQDGNKET